MENITDIEIWQEFFKRFCNIGYKDSVDYCSDGSLCKVEVNNLNISDLVLEFNASFDSKGRYNNDFELIDFYCTDQKLAIKAIQSIANYF